MIVALKALHLAALIVWCGALFALPLVLTHHDPHDDQGPYARLRLLTHRTYTRLATPAAVVAIGSGTALIFARSVFEPWLFAKLLAVGLLVCLHAFLGLEVTKMGESAGTHRPPRALAVVLALAVIMASALGLVLAKPTASAGLMPDWLLTPRQQPLPLQERPNL